jgi:chromate transporter
MNTEVSNQSEVSNPSGVSNSSGESNRLTVSIPFMQALRFWFKLGCISFGGPAGQIALMHRELVEERRWISEQRFLHALNYCMVLPGPEAQQLATYLGWLMHRTWGGLIAGGLFVLPSLILLIALSWVYMALGDQPLVAGILYGIKPAVLAIVLQAAHRLGIRTLRTPLHWALALAGLIALSLSLPFPLVIVGAALVGWVFARQWAPATSNPSIQHGARAAPHAVSSTATAGTPATPPSYVIDDHSPTPAHAQPSRMRLLRVVGIGLTLWALAMVLTLQIDSAQGTLMAMGEFFTKAALVTFGGAYAVLPYVVQGAVEAQGWLTPEQMIDGLALGESTPGPLIMVVAFVGFVGGWTQEVFGSTALLAGGIAGACVATVFTFLPSFVFILAGGPFVEATRDRLAFTAPLAAISASVVGVIVHLAIYFAGHVLWRDPVLEVGGSDAWDRNLLAFYVTGLDPWALALTLGAALMLMAARLNVLWVLAASGLAGLALSM